MAEVQGGETAARQPSASTEARLDGHHGESFVVTSFHVMIRPPYDPCNLKGSPTLLYLLLSQACDTFFQYQYDLTR